MNEQLDEQHYTPDDIKKEQQQLQDDFIRRTTDRDVEVVLDKKREGIKVPVKVAVRKNVQVSDLPAVWLFAFGNLTTEEYNKYLAENASNLTINEIMASQVLEGVMKGNREDKAIYWRLQESILRKPNTVQQKSNLTDLRPNAIMSKLLDEIEANVFKEAKEGEVINQSKEKPNK